MVLEELIPNGDNWSVSKNVIYYELYVKIPCAAIIEDVIYIIPSLKLSNQIIKLISNFERNNINFYFGVPSIVSPNCNLETLHKDSIWIILKFISNSKNFNKLKKVNFDLSKLISEYIKKFNCMEEFNETIIEFIEWLNGKHFDKNKFDFIDNNNNNDLKKFLLLLRRTIKLKIFFSSQI